MPVVINLHTKTHTHPNKYTSTYRSGAIMLLSQMKP